MYRVYPASTAQSNSDAHNKYATDLPLSASHSRLVRPSTRGEDISQNSHGHACLHIIGTVSRYAPGSGACHCPLSGISPDVWRTLNTVLNTVDQTKLSVRSTHKETSHRAIMHIDLCKYRRLCTQGHPETRAPLNCRSVVAVT